MKEVIIRFAQREDIKAITTLCQLHSAYEKAEYQSQGKEQSLTSHLFNENPSLYCLIAELDKEIVGYATYMKQFSTWDADFYTYMDCLFLMENSRGLGIGEKLIERIKVEAKRLGCKLIQWQTPDSNVKAQKFYYRIGAASKSKERFFLYIE